MKILFSVPADQLKAKRGEILALCAQRLPGSYVELDEAAELLSVEPIDQSGMENTAEELRLALLEIGVTATRKSEQRQNDSGAYTGWQPITPPPIQMNFKQPKTVRLWVFVLSLFASVLLVAILAYNIGTMTANPYAADGTLGTSSESEENYAEKIALIDYIFREYGLYDTDGKLLLDEMLKAYAAATGDKYAAYYTAEELEALMSEMSGEAVGIGVTVTKNEGAVCPECGEIMRDESECILVIQVMPNSPADKAGVKPGDLIVKVGDESVSKIGYSVAVQKMLGDEGTEAKFTVLRGGDQIDFTIMREAFEAVTVDGRVSTTDPAVGIVRITGFDANTPLQFKRAMNELIHDHRCSKFVFDVRNNPGGEQKSVMAVLSYFLTQNDVIMSTVTKDGTTTYFHAEPTSYTGDYAACSVSKEEIGMYRDYPITVLTNGHTASAGELFTAVLSEYDLATLVGENTYGKGVIQTIYDLAGMGYSGGIKLTVGYYAPPSGVNYDGKGIAPDIEVFLPEEIAGKNLYLLTESEDSQLAAAIFALTN